MLLLREGLTFCCKVAIDINDINFKNDRRRDFECFSLENRHALIEIDIA